MAHRGLNRPTKPSGIWGHTEPTASAPPRPKRAGMTLWVDGTERSWNLLGELFSLKLQQSWFSFSSVIIPQQQHALGSSAIVKVSEQAGAAPKDIPPGSHKVPTRFQGPRQVPTRFPRFLQGSCKVPARFPRFPKLCSTRFPQLCSNVPTRFPQFCSTRFPQLCSTRFPQLCPTRFPPGSHSFVPQGSHNFVPQGSHNFAPQGSRQVPTRSPSFLEGSCKVPARFPRFPQLCSTRFPQGAHSFAPSFPQGSHNFVPQRSHNFAPQGSHKVPPRSSTRAMDEVSTPSQAGGTSPMMGMRRTWSSSAVPGPQIPSAPAKDFWEDERRVYRLLKAAHLTKGERQNILTQTSNSEQH